MLTRILIHFVFLYVIFPCLINAEDRQIYWTDVGEKKIYRGSLDGSSCEAIISAPRKVSVFDAAEGIFYWVENGCINKKLMDNDSTKIVISEIRYVTHILVDPVHQKLYWNEFDTGKIWRVNPDGTKLEEIISDIGHPTHLTIDSEANKLYWIDKLAEKIQRSNLDGSEIEDVIADASTISDFVVDGNNTEIYYLDKEAHELNKANMDGSNKETVFSEIYSTNIELDLTRGKIYFDSYGGISRSNLDGTNVEELVSGFVIRIGGLNVDVKDNKIYWIDEWSNRIQRADLDGRDLEDVIINFYRTVSLALDMASSHVYWTDYANIYRANLDGSNIIFIANGISTGEPGLTDITLDIENNKIYWANSSDFLYFSIGRANFDGTDIDFSLSIGMQVPYGIDVDPYNKTLYWANYILLSQPSVRRISLEGGEIEILSNNLLAPYDIALDLKNSKIFWTEKARTGLIRRSNLDGSNMEDVITGLDSPGGIALDVAGGKMYWAEEYAGKILRANLDGTEVEEIFTGLTAPSRIALTFENNGLTTVDEGKATVDCIPTQFTLQQNFPNPFNPQTTIQYTLPKSCRVILTVYNMLGQEVKMLVNENQNLGYKSVVWDGKNDLGESVPSGVYIYRISAAEFTQSRKLLLLR